MMLGAPEAAEQPAEDNPLTHLRAGLTLIEHELIALDSLKLPRFLQMQVFVWPFLLLGGGVAGALGTQTSIGWTGAGIAGAVAALGSGIGAWIGLAGLARPRGAPCRPAAQGGHRRRTID